MTLVLAVHLGHRVVRRHQRDRCGLLRGRLQLVEREGGARCAARGEVGRRRRCASEHGVELVVDEPVVRGVVQHGRARERPSVRGRELGSAAVAGGEVAARQVVALVLVDHAEVARRGAWLAVTCGAERGNVQAPRAEGGVGSGEELGRAAVGELPEDRSRCPVHTARRGVVAPTARPLRLAQREVARLEAEPHPDNGAFGQRREDRWDRGPRPLVDHERVVDGDRAGRGVEDGRLDERGLVGVRLVAGARPLVGGEEPVGRREACRRQRRGRHDQRAVLVRVRGLRRGAVVAAEVRGVPVGVGGGQDGEEYLPCRQRGADGGGRSDDELRPHLRDAMAVGSGSGHWGPQCDVQ